MNHAPISTNVPIPGTETTSRVLVVDDEPQMCDICARILRRSGYDVETTSDPAVAVQLLSDSMRFDLLLTDIKMPGMSGLDMAHIAREHNPSIAIIIMTGFTSFEVIRQSVQRGVADFLSKPFELEHLRVAVEQALQKRLLLQNSLRLRVFEKLLENSEQLTSTLELSEVAHMLLQMTLQQSGCRAGFVVKVDPQHTPEIIAVQPADGQLLPVGLEQAKIVADQRQTVTVSDEPVCQVGDYLLHTVFSVTLRAQGEASGVLLLCDDAANMPGPGVQEEVVLLANHAGAAFRNALLYQQLGDAYQRLQELDRLKSEFISIASHELRTPLSLILGYGLMLRDRGEGEARDYAQRVMDGGQRIKGIIDDMVSLRHLETGETQLQYDLCSIGELVGSTVTQMRPLAEENEQTLQMDLPDQTLLFRCDRDKLFLILTHLLSNAIKFTPSGGTITVHASVRTNMPPSDVVVITQPTQTQATTSAHWVVVEVQDTGIGVAENEQHRIFGRFYQVADSLTRTHGGTGLGLAIVRELIHALGGIVWVRSREKHGSTFAFALPYPQEQAIMGEQL